MRHVPPSAPTIRLLDVLVDQLGHFEHRDFALTAKHGLELVVGVDHATLFRVLKPVALDVLPELLRDFRARNRIRSDDRGERTSRRLRRHEGGVRRTLLRLFRRSLLRSWLLLRRRLLRAALFRGFLSTLLCSHSLSR